MATTTTPKKPKPWPYPKPVRKQKAKATSAQTDILPEVLSPPQLGAYLQLSYTTTLRLLQNGTLPGRKVGQRHWRTHIRDVRDLLGVTEDAARLEALLTEDQRLMNERMLIDEDDHT